ncbi:MAG: M20/M25/M40 family metallo-hydrolase [Chryseolinea sp.]
MRFSLLLVLVLTMNFIAVSAQQTDEYALRQIFNESLTNGRSYGWLKYLTSEIDQRLSGSPGAAEAVTWTQSELANIADSIWLQPVMVPHWIRGQDEDAYFSIGPKKVKTTLNVCALGGSVGTGSSGVSGNVIEVKSFEELKELGERHVKGKIVFFNRPMDATRIHTFVAYSEAVDQRAMGASEAAKYGAIGVVVRSMGLNQEDYPHTGGMTYAPDIAKIPAIAISTKHAELLSKKLKTEKDLKFYFETHCETLPDVQSANVVAELRGSEYKDEIILVGGHLDSWDLAQGAHDDGAGCVQAMEVLRLFKALGITPKRTIRVVLFMNEENGLRGGTEYARLATLSEQKHIAAIESDDGGFTPRGFSMTSTKEFRSKVAGWRSILETYGLTDFSMQGGGADIGPLGAMSVPLIGYLPDSQRYFDYHHTKEDTLDKVSKRELELGAASMAALVYLLDKYGGE